MSVIDASVAVKWFVDEPRHEEALGVLWSDDELIGPDFVILETANVLRRKIRLGEPTEAQFMAALRGLPGYFDRIIPSEDLVISAARLALELNHSLYDCASLACAQADDTLMIASDLRFAQKAESAEYSKRIQRLNRS